MKIDYETDLTIIGAGPAGLTASIYAARANLNVILLDKNAPGGKVLTTATVENYPGFVNITGPDLSLKFFEQAQKLKVKFIFNEAINIKTSKEDNYKYIELKDNKVIKTKAVIIATGMINRQIGCVNETAFFHKGISYCAICDGALYKNCPVAVIGSGRSAVEEAIFLSDIASSVTIISNKKNFKADQIKVDQLKEIKNVKVLMETDTLSFNGNDVLSSITLRNQLSNKIFQLNVNAAFIFIGFLPLSPTVNYQSILSTSTNFIEVDNNMETSYHGIFAAGDIINKRIRQISTAINDGTIAALSVTEYIKDNNWN